jgi:hypothetical protein
MKPFAPLMNGKWPETGPQNADEKSDAYQCMCVRVRSTSNIEATKQFGCNAIDDSCMKDGPHPPTQPHQKTGKPLALQGSPSSHCVAYFPVTSDSALLQKVTLCRNQQCSALPRLFDDTVRRYIFFPFSSSGRRHCSDILFDWAEKIQQQK